MHGGLRYLATGNIGIARRSAAERGNPDDAQRPHLGARDAATGAAAAVDGRPVRALVRTGFVAGDALRRLAWYTATTLPRSGRVTAERAVQLVPGCDATASTGVPGL